MKKLPVRLTPTQKTWGFSYLAFQFLVLQTLLVSANVLLGSPMSKAELNFLFFAINFFCTTIIFHRFLIDSGTIAFRQPLRTLSAAFYGFILNYLGNIGISLLIRCISPEFYNVNDSSIQTMAQENYILIAVGTVILAPVAEELLFRALIFGDLYNRSRFLAYAISVILFSGVHVLGYIFEFSPIHLLLCFIQYVPSALIMGWVYARAGTIWSPILLHIVINLIAILSMR